MEKETKEWGNKEQRTMLHTLRVMFPEVDIRIIKATVLEGNDVDAAVEFILTEVLEQPWTGKVDKRPAKELKSGFLKTAGDSSDKDSIEVKSVDHHEVKDQKLFDTMSGMSNVTVSSIQDGNIFVDQQPLINLRSDKAVEGSKLPSSGSSPIDIPSGTARTRVESVTCDEVLHSPYVVMSLTESEPLALAGRQGSGQACLIGEMTLSEFLRKVPDGNQLVQPTFEAEVTDESANMTANMAESLYTSVMDVGIETDHPGTDAGTRELEDPWCDDENRLEKHSSSQGRGCDYDSDDDYSDLPELKSLLIPVPTVQFDGMSRYSCEGSSLVASSVLEETYDGLFNSSSYNVMYGSSQQLGFDALDELVNSAKSDKEVLVTAIEEMRAMRSAVQRAEAAAQQAKRDAMNGGLDVLAKVEEMQVMLDRAREANEKNFLEVYGEKAVLRTESQGLQRRLAQLKAEKDRAFAAVQELRATLQARIDRANEEREAAEEEKRLKEARARAMLAVEAELTAKVAQESRRLDAEEEACTKLRDFLIDRGSIVDSLQGEVAIICEDVEAIKKQLDEGILLGESGFLQLKPSR